MVKEQSELKEELAKAKKEARARANDQAQDEIKFNELYRQRETELNALKLELQYACMFRWDCDLCHIIPQKILNPRILAADIS